MELHKIDYIRHQPTMTDYNMLVDTINTIIKTIKKKKEIIPISINREVKDFSFFQGEETKLPYSATHLLLSPEDAYNVFNKYELTYKETNNINTIITGGDIVSLTINVEEIKTKNDKKQETMFTVIETITDSDNIQLPTPTTPTETTKTKKKRKTKKESTRKDLKHK